MGHRILLVGSGGREHALTGRLLASPLCARLVVAPGNVGIEAQGRRLSAERFACAPVAADDVPGLLALAGAESIDLVVCGPEVPLAAGLGDAFAAQGVRFFGPTRAAAEIESSKSYAKRLMAAAGVPTAAHGSFTDLAAAEAFIDAQPGPVVVKADGLCAGKGVVVTTSKEEARQAVRGMLGDGRFGAAGARVVIEERLFGPEVSVMAFCDGERVALLASAEDHKAAYDGDRGPNTGGMGAYSPSPLVDEALSARIVETIFLPTVRALAEAQRPFRGLLYGGLMLTADGPKVIEWNGRFGDPETQAVLLRLQDDVVPWLLGAAEGRLPPGAPRFSDDTSICVVLAAEGYPEKVRTGDLIRGLAPHGGLADSGLADSGISVFHAGTRAGPEGTSFVTAGGRVLGVSGCGPDLAAARDRVYRAIQGISWPGMFFRSDIGLRSRNDSNEKKGS
jgi:phosphoribosylamine---glycine ligase